MSPFFLFFHFFAMSCAIIPGPVIHQRLLFSQMARSIGAQSQEWSCSFDFATQPWLSIFSFHRDDSPHDDDGKKSSESTTQLFFRPPLSATPCRISALLFQFCPVYQVGQLRWRVKRGSKVVADYTRPPFSLQIQLYTDICHSFHG